MARPLDMRIRYLPLRSVDGTSLANPALWYPIGDPLEAPARVIKFDNLTNQTIFISVNGAEAFTVIPPVGFFLLDVTTNSPSHSTGLYANEGTQYYAQAATTPASEKIYVTAISTDSE